MVESIVRSANRVSEANIRSQINKLSEYPGFEEVEVVNVESEEIGGSAEKRVFKVILRDKRLSREEVFYVYRFDPFAE